VIVIVLSILLTVGGGVAGADSFGGKLGAFLGVVGGGAVSALMAFFFLLRRGLFIGGACFLTNALTFTEGMPVWDKTGLAFGGVMLLVALLSGGRSSSTRSRSS